MLYVSCTCLKLFDFNSQNNDGYHEENSQTTQDHTRDVCLFIRLLYKKNGQIKLSFNLAALDMTKIEIKWLHGNL